MKDFYKRVLISMLDVAKSGAGINARQHFAGTLSAIALSKKPLREAGKARASVKVVRASVKPGVFTHISFAIARVSAKEQQELAMCWRWDRVSKTHGSAIVIDTRTEGSKGFGHGSIGAFRSRLRRCGYDDTILHHVFANTTQLYQQRDKMLSHCNHCTKPRISSTVLPYDFFFVRMGLSGIVRQIGSFQSTWPFLPLRVCERLRPICFVS